MRGVRSLTVGSLSICLLPVCLSVRSLSPSVCSWLGRPWTSTWRTGWRLHSGSPPDWAGGQGPEKSILSGHDRPVERESSVSRDRAREHSSTSCFTKLHERVWVISG
ncbi:hypothetical protein BDV59DRAFT_189307 [Aspergillus ambiguus]|uniref:uncharacterized protein n=1 Tax=Aspergillus ambiguus TaxID=176160 RepID=UPI003CCD36DF